MIEQPKYRSVIESLEMVGDKAKVRFEIGESFVSTSLKPGHYVSNKINYRLYRCQAEINSETFFLYTTKRLSPGEATLCLSSLSEEKKRDIWEHPPDVDSNIGKICEFLEIEEKESTGEKLSNLNRLMIALNRQDTFFQEQPFLTDLEFTTIVMNEDLTDFVDLILNQGFDKDNRVTLVYKSQLIEFDNETRPKEVMPYQSHALVFTNTKVGKTSTAEAIGEKIDRLTSARFLGYSDSKGAHPGDIHYQTKPFFIEEIGDTPETAEIARYGLNILELGEAKIATGQKSFVVKTLSSLTFHGNVKDIINGATEFETLLSKISNNPVATGSRFGIVLFGDNYAEATAVDPVDTGTIEKAFAVWKCLEEKARPAIMTFFRSNETQKWLGQPIDIYNDELDIIAQATPYLVPNVKAFIKSQKKAYRHIRGAALKLALVDHMRDFLLGTIDKGAVISTASRYLNDIIKLNLESFETITKVQLNKQALKKHVFDNMPEYQKALVRLAKEIVINHPELVIPDVCEQEIILLLADSIREPYKQLSISGSYQQPSIFLATIPKDKKALNQNLKFFGVAVGTFIEAEWIFILDKDELLTTNL